MVNGGTGSSAVGEGRPSCGGDGALDLTCLLLSCDGCELLSWNCLCWFRRCGCRRLSMFNGGTGSGAFSCCGVDGVDGVDGVESDEGGEGGDGDEGVEGGAGCQWLSVALSVLGAWTLVQRPRKMRVVTVDGVRAEVHGNVFEPAAMLESKTSQTGAAAPSSRQGQALT